MPYQPRTYRDSLKTDGLIHFSVLIKETDLFIAASHNAEAIAREAVLDVRFKLEQYIEKHPEFLISLVPLPEDEYAPDIVQALLRASAAAGVGPMAAVAGAVAEYTGREILKSCDEVIVENGGDIFLKVVRDVTLSIYAGASPLSNRIGIKISPPSSAWGVCTSSGTVGPSLSLGTADAVTIVSSSASLADAAATAIGNLVNAASDIQKAIDSGKQIEAVTGILIIKDEHMGVWGNINLVAL
jgi:ApbE superfamily uncharacterized protein (UPF0280 family)